MKGSKPGEKIYMSFITTNTVMDGKVSLLVSVDGFSDYCFGIAVQKESSFLEVTQHITSILKDVNKRHPKVKPHFIMAYGNEMMDELKLKFKNIATFKFDPILADEVAMPAAKLLLNNLRK
jgi:hypothetical protein